MTLSSLELPLTAFTYVQTHIFFLNFLFFTIYSFFNSSLMHSFSESVRKPINRIKCKLNYAKGLRFTRVLGTCTCRAVLHGHKILFPLIHL